MMNFPPSEGPNELVNSLAGKYQIKKPTENVDRRNRVGVSLSNSPPRTKQFLGHFWEKGEIAANAKGGHNSTDRPV
jgi:hypothetical protein